MRDLTVTAIGDDRPGIVAAVTEVLYGLGCNLADCAMSLLRKQFAMILLVEAPDEVTKDGLQASLNETARQLGLTFTVREVTHADPEQPGRPYVISLYGADRPGIVHHVSKALAGRRINITDLVSHLVGDIYTMVIDIDLPSDADPDDVEAELKRIAGQLEVDVTFRPSEPDEL